MAGLVIAVAAVWLIAAAPALAQCAMCKAAIAGSDNPAELSRVIDDAVLVLLVPAVVIFGAVILLVFRFRHSQGGEMDRDAPAVDLPEPLQGIAQGPEFIPRHGGSERQGEWSIGPT